MSKTNVKGRLLSKYKVINFLASCRKRGGLLKNRNKFKFYYFYATELISKVRA